MTILKIRSYGETSYYRCNLAEASSPVQHWCDEDKTWEHTQYQCADCEHTDDGLADIAIRLEAEWNEVPEEEFRNECEWGTVENFGYEVFDQNSGENFETFDEAADRIEGWYEDCDEWATGEINPDVKNTVRDAIIAVERPEDGNIRTLKKYADQICKAVAEAMGNESFAGHGTYHVSAADRGGFTLEVGELTDPR